MSKKGGSSKTQTATTTTSIPKDVLKNYNEVVAQAKNVASQPLQQYQGKMLADFNPQQTAGFGAVQNAQGLYQPYFDQAQGLLSSATGDAPTFDPSQLEQYMSPYNQDVINSTMALAHQNDAAQQSALTGNAISSGAWGGDRAGVAKAALAGQQQLANNSTIANLNNQNYTQALNQYNTMNQMKQQQNALNLQGAGIAGNLGTSAFQNALTGAAANIEAGNQQQQQEQNALNIPYEQFQQAQQYPFQTTGWLANIVEGIGANSGGSSATTTPAQQSSGKGGFLGMASGGRTGYEHGGSVPEDHYGFGGALSFGTGGLMDMMGGAGGAGGGGGSPSGGGEQSKFSQYVGDAAKIAKIAAMFMKDGGRTGYAPGGYVMPESGNYKIVPDTNISFSSHSQSAAPGLDPGPAAPSTLNSLLGAATTAYGFYKDPSNQGMLDSSDALGNWFNNSILDTGSDFMPGTGHTSYDIGEGSLPDFASGGRTGYGLGGNILESFLGGSSGQRGLKDQGLPDVAKDIVGSNPISNFAQANLPSAPQIPASSGGGKSGGSSTLSDIANIAKVAMMFMKDGGAVPNGYAPGGSIPFQQMRQSILDQHPSLSQNYVSAPSVGAPTSSVLNDFLTNGTPNPMIGNLPLSYFSQNYTPKMSLDRLASMTGQTDMAGPVPTGGVAPQQETQPVVDDQEVAGLIGAENNKVSPESGIAARPDNAPQSSGLDVPELDKGKALMAAGAAMMADTSPYAVVGIGHGIQAGLENLERQKESRLSAQEKAMELAQRAEQYSKGNSYTQQFQAVQDAHPDWTPSQVQDYVYTRGQMGKALTRDETGSLALQKGAAEAAGDMKYEETSGVKRAELEYNPEIKGQEKSYELAAEKKATQPKALNALRSSVAQKQNVISKTNDILPRIGPSTAGFWATSTPFVKLAETPGTPAYDLARDLETVRANAGFDKLQEMRDNSPTGGALGAISDRENALLASSWSNVEQSQSPKQLEKNLKTFQQQTIDSWDRIKNAYEQDYGALPDPEGTRIDPKEPKTQKDFDEIPVGSWFINPKDYILMRKSK